MPEQPDPTAPYRNLLAAIRDALDVPLSIDLDQTSFNRLQRDRARVVLAITDAALDDASGCGGCVEAATEVIRERVRELPVTYRRYIPEAEGNPADCVICGPGCVAPTPGVHTSCPGPLVGRTVESVR